MRISARLALAAILLGCSVGALPAQAQNFIRTIGSLGSGNGQMNSPIGVAVDTANGSNVIVADTNNNRIEVFSANGAFISAFGSLGSGDLQLNQPSGVAVDTANGSNVIVADTNNNRIEVFSANGNFIRAFGSLGSGDGQMNTPSGVAVDTANGSNIIVTDEMNARIEVFDSNGNFIRTFGSAGTGNGQFGRPLGIAVDTANGSNVVVADDELNRIDVFSSTGSFIRSFGSTGSGNGQLNFPVGVAVNTGHGSDVIVGDTNNNRIEVFSSLGSSIRVFGTLGSGDGQLNNPFGVAVDTANDGNVLVADWYNSRIEVFGDGNIPVVLGAAILPGSRSVEIGKVATVFATMVSASPTALDNCIIALQGGSPTGLSLDYQATDPSTNAPIGLPDQPVSLAPHGTQSFVLSFSGTTAFSSAALAPIFSCNDAEPAPIVAGVDTVDLNVSTTPTPDIIAIAVAAGGILTIPQSTGGAGAFANASINAGTAGTMTVATNTGAADLPLTATICPTDPTTAACLSPPAASVQTAFQPNGTQTYSVFATASAPITFSPGTARVFVSFTDGNGILRGSTSVAVQTE